MRRPAALLAFVLLSACGATGDRTIPAGFDFATARPYGIEGVAFAGDLASDALVARASGPVIAFSGGGEFGAFGAGIVTGWTERGDRPEFATVTGVSTGSILALFTFLGPDYDDELRDVYSRYGTKDLLRIRILPAVFGSPAINSADGYRRLIEDYVDEEVLRRVAAEGARGRQLIVVSTDIDRELPVHWDLTALAASGHPQALELMRDVIQASSAVPVIFPPVFIPLVDGQGRRFDAMHVDGGTTLQFSLLGLAEGLGARGNATSAYVVINDFLDPVPQAKSPHILAIAEAATSTLIDSAVVSEAARTGEAARASGVPIRFAAIPSGFTRPGDAEFDPAYMRSLQALGRQLVLEGRLWQEAPAGPS